MRARLAILAFVVGLVVAAPAPAQASHHLWKLNQMFSNASGSVQFVQLKLVQIEDGEDLLATMTLTSGTNTFTFPNLPSSQTSAHPWILLATAGFGQLPGGVAPDFTIPANFFPTGGGTLNYASNGDVWNYTAVPTDGLNAFFKSGATVTTARNAPENFNTQSGSVNLAAAVPALPAVGIALLVGALLFAGSGLARRKRT
jgi:hypothetical protein